MSWEWDLGHVDLEELAQRWPALTQIEGEKAVGGDYGLHLGDVFSEDPSGMVPFRHSVIEDLNLDCLDEPISAIAFT